MAITTSVARHYALRTLILGVLCVIFGLWGVYDYFIKIPREQQVAERFEQATRRYGELQSLSGQGGLTAEQQQEAQALDDEISRLAPGGRTPHPPSRFDHILQLVWISCLLFAPWFFWQYAAARRRSIRMEDDGSIRLANGDVWPAEQIQGIDMSRWMSRSVATLIHRDGRRLQLDDYVQRDAHRIVGHYASRYHPEQWDEQARRLPEDAAATEAGDEGGAVEPAATGSGARDDDDGERR